MGIACEKNECNDWDRHLDKTVRDINSSVNKTNGKTPYEASLGYQPRFGKGRLNPVLRSSVGRDKPQIVQT